MNKSRKLIENIKVLCHSSIVINLEKVIYIDPFRINQNYKNADIIMITHDHYDHYSEEDIQKVKKEDTIIVIPEDLLENVQKLGFSKDNIIAVKPNEKYVVENIKLETIPAYNINKNFHPKENNWLGYILTIKDIKYYIAGDTDITDENKKVKCDVALVSIGGTYTMNYKEAAELINYIKPELVIPTHYGEIVGKKEDAIEFIKLINPDIDSAILIQ